MKKYLVIGNPIAHSLSPKLHNHWIKENNIDAIYEKKQFNESDIALIEQDSYYNDLKHISFKEREGSNFDHPNSIDFDFEPDIIVDAILGTGIVGEIREPYASAINYINKIDCYKFAVDVPSGLDPQTGDTANIYTKCNLTVTFHKMKQGIPKRKDLTGELFVEKIGIPPEAENGIL